MSLDALTGNKTFKTIYYKDRMLAKIMFRDDRTFYTKTLVYKNEKSRFYLIMINKFAAHDDAVVESVHDTFD